MSRVVTYTITILNIESEELENIALDILRQSVFELKSHKGMGSCTSKLTIYNEDIPEPEEKEG